MSANGEILVRRQDGEKLRHLDQVLINLAHSFDLNKWFNGLDWRPTSAGFIMESEHINDVINDFSIHSDNSRVKDLLILFEELGLKISKPNYDYLIELFTDKIKDVDKPKVVFMLGAGASKPAPSEIPTINEMLPFIVSKLPPGENPIANKIREWYSRGNVNIEDIMTAGYLSSLLVSETPLFSLVDEIIYRVPSSTRQTRTRELRERLRIII